MFLLPVYLLHCVILKKRHNLHTHIVLSPLSSCLQFCGNVYYTSCTLAASR